MALAAFLDLLNADDGRAYFKQRCASCHQTEPGASSALGPNLRDVVGRGAGATPFRYSVALKTSGITWNRENLDAFLASPQKMVPGTRMVISVPDYAQRALLLDYLASISATPVPSNPAPPAGVPHHAGH